jgi:hypothetical protein
VSEANINRLLKKACFEKTTIKIIGGFAWFFIEKIVFQQPVNGRTPAIEPL